MSIRIGNALKRAFDKIRGNADTTLKQTESGLWVPPDLIAGKHFGGFTGYDDWIQDCIRASCEAARGVGPDELSEITALASWSGPGNVEVYFGKHAVVLDMLEQFMGRIGELVGNGATMSPAARTQFSRAQGKRELGTILVIAMNLPEAEKTGKLMTSVSAWNPASIEEAKAVPKQEYLLG